MIPIDWATSTSYTDDGSADPDGTGTPVGITAGNTYRYAVAAYRHDGTTDGNSASDWSNLITQTAATPTTTPLPKPAAPTGLAVTAASGTSISLSWTAPADDSSGAIEGYNIYRCDQSSDSNCDTFPWIAWATSTSYTDDGSADPDGTGTPVGITAGNTYRYAVAAYRHDGTTDGDNSASDWSNLITQTAATPTTTPLPKPAAPTGLAVTAASGTSISLSWTAPADDSSGAIEGYNIYRCDQSSDSNCDTFPWIAWATSTSYTDDGSADPDGTGTPVGITAGNTYRYAVAAYRHDGTTDGDNSASDWSNLITQTAATPTTTPLPKPAAPTGLAVTAASGTSISLSWTAPADDSSGAIEGYNIYRCDQSSDSNCDTFPWIAWATSTSYTDDGSADPDGTGTPVGITAGNTYRYAVAAYRHDGTTDGDNSASDWSNLITQTAATPTTTPLPKPAAPTGLAVTAASGTSISLSWTAPADDSSGAIEGYNIYRCDQSSDSNCDTFPWIAWATSTSYTDDGSADPDGTGTPVGITAGNTYRYAVAAYRHDGTTDGDNSASDWSNLITQTAATPTTTPLPKPAAPTGLAVTAASGTSISLSWTAPADDSSGAIEGYNIYRCDQSSDSNCDTFPWIAWATSTSYTDDGSADPDGTGTPVGITAGNTYRYAVAAYRHDGTTDGDNSASDWSNLITQTAATPTTTPLPKPAAPTGWQPAAPPSA